MIIGPVLVVEEVMFMFQVPSAAALERQQRF